MVLEGVFGSMGYVTRREYDDLHKLLDMEFVRGKKFREDKNAEIERLMKIEGDLKKEIDAMSGQLAGEQKAKTRLINEIENERQERGELENAMKHESAEAEKMRKMLQNELEKLEANIDKLRGMLEETKKKQSHQK